MEILGISLNLMVLLEIFMKDARPHWFPVIKLGTRSLRQYRVNSITMTSGVSIPARVS